MRKFVALFLAVSLSVAVVGCGEAKKEPAKPASGGAASGSTPAAAKTDTGAAAATK